MKLSSKSTQNVSHDNDQGKKESRSVALERASERASYSWHFHRKCNFCSWLLWLTRAIIIRAGAFHFLTEEWNNRIGSEARRWAEIRGNEARGMQEDSGSQGPTTLTILTIQDICKELSRERRKHFSFTRFTVDSLISDDDVNVMHFVLCVICILFLGSVVVWAAVNERMRGFIIKFTDFCLHTSCSSG